MNHTYDNHQSQNNELAGRAHIEAIEKRDNLIDLGVRLVLAAIPETEVKQPELPVAQQSIAPIIPLRRDVVEISDPGVDQARQNLESLWRNQNAA